MFSDSYPSACLLLFLLLVPQVTLHYISFHSHIDGAASGAIWESVSCPRTLGHDDCRGQGSYSIKSLTFLQFTGRIPIANNNLLIQSELDIEYFACVSVTVSIVYLFCSLYKRCQHTILFYTNRELYNTSTFRYQSNRNFKMPLPIKLNKKSALPCGKILIVLGTLYYSKPAYNQYVVWILDAT